MLYIACPKEPLWVCALAVLKHLKVQVEPGGTAACAHIANRLVAHEASEDYMVWETTDGGREWCLKEPESLYDYILEEWVFSLY